MASSSCLAAVTPEGKAHGPSKCLIRSHVWYRPHQVIPPGWDVKALLIKIAEQPESQRYSALIDTGALITGLDNLQVRYASTRSCITPSMHGRRTIDDPPCYHPFI